VARRLSLPGPNDDERRRTPVGAGEDDRPALFFEDQAWTFREFVAEAGRRGRL